MKYSIDANNLMSKLETGCNDDSRLKRAYCNDVKYIIDPEDPRKRKAVDEPNTTYTSPTRSYSSPSNSNSNSNSNNTSSGSRYSGLGYLSWDIPSKILTIFLPILAFIVGQIVQYASGNLVLADMLFDNIGAIAILVSSVLCLINTVIVCILGYNIVDDAVSAVDILCCWTLFILFSMAVAICPFICGYVGIVILVFLSILYSSFSEVSLVPVTSAFVLAAVLHLMLVGQDYSSITLWLSFGSFVLTVILCLYEDCDGMRNYLVVTLFVVCTVMAYLYSWWVLIPLIVLTIALLIWINDCFYVLYIVGVVVFVIVLVVSVIFTGANIVLGDVRYQSDSDGYYYAVEYVGDDDYAMILRELNGQYEVAGVSDDFLIGDYFVLDFDYCYATSSCDYLCVVVFSADASMTLPVPEREGYTFYGWWGTQDRLDGTQVSNEYGQVYDYIDYSCYDSLYAMWYDDDYVFISSADEFVVNSSGGNYVLLCDIDLGNYYTPIGYIGGMELQNSRVAFNGIFDGNYHTISYSITDSMRYSGLFSWIGGSGTVKNLGVDAYIDVTFNPTDYIYYAFAGGIAAINDGTIVNCWTEGSISLCSYDGVTFVGGIAGGSGTDNAMTGSITACYNGAELYTYSDDAYAGGILGTAENYGHAIYYCYNAGTVQASGTSSNNTAAGGILSHARTFAYNCLNTGAVMSEYYNKQTLGGIVGYVRDTSYHCYYPTDCVWIPNLDCQAIYAIGQYSTDGAGNSDEGVTIAYEMDQSVIDVLNGIDTEYFVLVDSQIYLYWQTYLL